MNNLELHYYLENESHSMNAFVKNRSEAELLRIFNEIFNILEVEIEIEFEAIQQGGLKEIAKFFTKKKTKKRIQTYIVPIITAVLVGILINYATKDSELDELTKTEKRLNIKKLQGELENNIGGNSNLDQQKVDQIIYYLLTDHKLQVHKSRFYQELIKESKIYKFSTLELNNNFEPISKEVVIQRESFFNQVLEDENGKTITIEDANVEIVSPVLKQGNIKWKGLYKNQPINFLLKDSDFQKLVLNREIGFKNGTSIKCSIKYKECLNENGELIFKEIEVFDVLEIFEGDKRIETKKSKAKKELAFQTKMEFE